MSKSGQNGNDSFSTLPFEALDGIMGLPLGVCFFLHLVSSFPIRPINFNAWNTVFAANIVQTTCHRESLNASP